jgi:MFS family permease
MSPSTVADDRSSSPRSLFWACFIALIATSFVFGVRSTLIGGIGREFQLSQGEIGRILGVGLWPFALSIMFFSLIIDVIGYKAVACCAIVCHFAALALTLSATPDNNHLYWGTFLVAVANGTVESFINPVVATLFNREKSKWLNILHAGWPLGIALGSIFTLVFAPFFSGPGQWKVIFTLCFIPVVVYTLLVLPRRFPVNERVVAGVSYREMLTEFGAAGFFLFSTMFVMAVYQANDRPVDWTVTLGVGLAVAVIAGVFARSLGRPMFLVILLTMPFLATTELGTDTWMPELLSGQFGARAAWVLVYSALIMTVLRAQAGPVVERFSPIGLLALSAAVAIAGLLLLYRMTGVALIAAATVYAFGKTFLWSTTLGVVSEQFPRGGALSLNGVSAIGVLGMGVIGAPLMGVWQDLDIDRSLRENHPGLHEIVRGPDKPSLIGPAPSLDSTKVDSLSGTDRQTVVSVQNEFKKLTFARTALLPAFLLVCYLGLFAYFRSRGGYRPEELGAGH